MKKEFKHNINKNFFSPILIGMAFAFGWTPCIGPILGSILVLASTEESLGERYFTFIFLFNRFSNTIYFIWLSNAEIFNIFKKF